MSRPATLLRLLWCDLRHIRWRLLVARALMAPLPRMSFGWLRPTLLRYVGGLDIDVRSIILGPVDVEGAGSFWANLHVGRGCMLTTPLYLNTSALVSIGERVVIGHHVVIATDTHDISDPQRRGGERTSRPVSIGDGAWLGACVTILPGVTIGPGAVVAAGALVHRDVPAHTLVGGVPARVIKALPTN